MKFLNNRWLKDNLRRMRLKTTESNPLGLELLWSWEAIGSSSTPPHLEAAETRHSIPFKNQTLIARVWRNLNKKKKVGFSYGYDVSSEGRNWGHIEKYCKHFIDCTVKGEEEDAWWRFIRFYGAPIVNGKRESCNLLKHLKSDDDTLRLVGGDLNEILEVVEALV